MKQLIVFVLLVVLAACNGNDPKTTQASPRATQIANAFCQCTARLVVLNETAKSIQQDTTAVAQFEEQLKAVEQEYARAQECAGRLRERFGALSPEDFKEINDELGRTCSKLENRSDLMQELLGQ